MNKMDYLKLSKEVSYALRHCPWEYELELESEGWIDIQKLVISLRGNSIWDSLEESDLQIMIDKSEKQRHEIKNGKIRALYGHSLPFKIEYLPASPPEILYHGTAARFVPSILENGLLPQLRQYVHLSQDIETAFQVGKRRDSNPVIFQINTVEAFALGVKFYYGNEKVWLADSIPNRFLKILSDK